MKKKDRKQKKQSSAARKEARSYSERERTDGSRTASLCLILHLIDKLISAIYSCLANGLFGRIFTAYSAEQRAFESGFVSGYFTERGSGFFRRVRARFSKAFEGSYLLDKLGTLLKRLMGASVKNYGNLFLSFGIYSIIATLFRQLIQGAIEFDIELFGLSILSIIVSFPMLLSKESLGSALGRGRITRLIFVNAFGFKNEDFDIVSKRTRRRANVSIMTGIILGLMTFFVNSYYLIFGCVAVVAVLLVMASPEIGIMIGIFAVPFCSFFGTPTIVLAAILLCSFVGYVIKLIRGKRVFKVEILDLFVIFFTVLVFMSGVISAGGKDSFYSALMCCVLILGYFMTVNLLRKTVWINRCVNAIVASGVITAVFGVLQYIFGDLSADWIDTAYFDNISGRAVSFFDNPNVLATYLTIVFPFVLSKLFSAQGFRCKLLAFLSTAAVLVCIVTTYSRAAWIAVLFIIVLYGLLNTKKMLKALFGLAFVVPFLFYLLPGSVKDRFLSIGDISESSNFYRLYTWRGTLEAIKDNLLGGIGFGTEAYAEIYPSYAYAGIEAAEHSHNLYLQLILGLGVFGFLTFVAIIFFFAQKNFEFFRNGDKGELKTISIAAFSAVMGVLVLGLFDYPWYNYRMFFTFWVVIAISCACIRCADREAARQTVVDASDSENASIDI